MNERDLDKLFKLDPHTLAMRQFADKLWDEYHEALEIAVKVPKDHRTDSFYIQIGRTRLGLQTLEKELANGVEA